MGGGEPALPGSEPQPLTPAPGLAGASPPSDREHAAPLPPPPQFDIEDSDSDDEVATVMMDVQGTDLSSAIEQALARQQQIAGPSGASAQLAGSPGVPANLGAPPAAPGLPVGTPVETALQGAPNAPAPQGALAPHPHFELLVAEGEPENAGLKRALIVAVVLLVIVVAAVVVLYLGQEGVLSN